MPKPLRITSGPSTRKRNHAWLRRIPAAVLLLLGSSGAWAQTVKTLPGDYPSLAAAITDLNTNGVPAGGFTLNIAAGYTETAVNLTLTATGTSANPIVFQKSGSGANPLLTAGVGTSLSSDGMIRLSGADYVTFDGIDVAENSANTTATTQLEFGYALFRASATDGCQNNTIRNCVVTLNKLNTATIGIAGLSFTTASTTVLPATSPTGANSANKVYGNVVSNSLTGINFAAGSATTTANYDQNNEIGVTAPNTIGNFGGTASGWGAGGSYQNGLKVSGNIINSTLNYTSATASTPVAASTVTSTLRGVYGNTGTSSNVDMVNNTVTLASGATTSQLSGIENSIGGTAAGNTVNITGNTVSLSYTTATSATVYGIYNSITPATVNISGNTISATLSNTGSTYLIDNNTSAATINVLNNVASLTRTGASGTAYGYYNNGSGSGTHTLTGNTINNVTMGGTSTFYGLYNTSSSSETQVYTGNTISNVTGGSGGVYGIYVTLGAAASQFSNNVVNRLSGTGPVYGINLSNTGFTAAGNTINTLSTSGSSGTVYGFYTAATTASISRNKIYDLSGTAAGATVYGLYTAGGTTINLTNNLVGDLRAPAATGLNAVAGVYLSSGTTVNAYYNTVYLNATSSGATFGTSGVYFTATPTLDLRNNLIINKSTAAGTGGLTAALRRSTGTAGTAPANLAGTTNNNLYYAGAPSASNLIYVEGTSTATNAAQTIAGYKTLVANREASSQTEDAAFLSTTGSAATFLHLNPAQPTLAEGKAQPISGITVDFDGDTRNTSTPDIGADEGTFTPGGAAVDVQPVVLASPAATGCYSATETVRVTIQNNGTATLDFTVNPATVTVSLTGAVTQTLTATVGSGTLAPGATQTVSLGTLDMSTAGTYSFAITATAQGDGNTSNDNATGTRTVVAPLTVPLAVVDFTAFTGSNLPTAHPGWYEASGATAPAGTASAWTSTTGLGSATNVTAKINLYTTTRNEWLVGPKFTATAASQLTFKAAITDFASTTTPDGAGMTGTDDAVRVLVSTDCGLTFTEVFQVNASNQPSATAVAFSNYTVPLGSYAGQSIIVALKATDGPADDAPDYDFHVDDLLINEAASADVGITALTEPGTAGCYSASQNVTVTIKNYGLAAQTNIPVQVVVGGALTQTLTGTFTGSIAPGGTASFTVGQINMSAAGTYTFDASTQLPADANAGNNALVQQTRTRTALATLPQQVNFTGYTGANLTTLFPSWSEATGATTPGGTSSAWTSDDYANVVSGPNGIAAKINLYSNTKNEWIAGPRFLATATSVLTYDIALTEFAATTAGTLGSDDRLEVRVSADCGTTFTTVKAYTAATAISNTGQSETIQLGSYAGQEIIVAFFATEGSVDDSNDNDVFLDNISLTNPAALDLAPAALTTPVAGQSCYSNAEPVSVTVKNLGIQTIDFAVNPATVTVSITGAVTQTLTATLSSGTLAPGATQSVSLGALDMSTAGTYSFAITATIQGDGNTSNDGLTPTVTRTVTAPAAGTLTPGTASLCQSGALTLTLAGSANGTIQWQQSADNVTFTSISGATAATYTTPTLTATTYFRALTSCGSNVATSNVATVTVNNPQVTAASSPVAICGPGTATLTATASQGTITWYDDATTATSLATGPTFSASVTASRQFFVAAVVSSTATGGRTAPATVSSTTPSSYGLVLNATQPFTLATVDVYPTSTAGSLVVQLQNSTGTVLQTATVAVPAGNATTPVAFAVPLNFAVPAGTGLRLVAISGPSMVRESALGGFPYGSSDGVVNITSGYISGASANYYYFYNWQYGSSCASARTAVQVNVDAAPTATAGTATAQICAGTTYQLAGTIGGSATTGTYTTTGTGTFSPSATDLNAVYTPSAADIAAGGVTLTLTAAGPAGSACQPATAQTVLTINPATSAAFSYAAASYCQGSGAAATATVTGTAGGTFSSTAGLVLDAATGTINLATSTPGTYTVTYSVGGTCPSSATFAVTINPATSAAFSYAGTTLCVSGSSATPTVTGTAGGTFSSTAGLSLNAATGTITPAVSTPGTYTVTYTVSGACGSSATATVTITSAPVAAFSYATASYCQVTTGTAAPVFGAGASAGTFSSTAGLAINAATGVINLATSTPGTYVVTNTIAASGGCATAAATFSVTINARPAQPTISIRYNGPVTTLTSSSTTGNQWYLNGSLIVGATAPDYVVSSAAQFGNYTVVVTNAAGCASLPSSIQVVTSAVKPLAGSVLDIYPNPTTNGLLTVKLAGYAKTTELTVYDAVGKLVHTLTVSGSATQHEVQLNLSQLPTGVYLLRARTEGGLDVRRIVRE